MFALKINVTTAAIVSARLGLIIDGCDLLLDNGSLLHFPDGQDDVLTKSCHALWHRHFAANHDQPQYTMGKAGPDKNADPTLTMGFGTLSIFTGICEHPWRLPASSSAEDGISQHSAMPSLAGGTAASRSHTPAAFLVIIAELLIASTGRSNRQALINFELTTSPLSKPPAAATVELSGSIIPIRFKDRLFPYEDLMVP
ncbi:hypothetical protein E2P81_ATG11852 [Venturia nashicola]|nr:hypothetical protein E2P81_ATG11852 [Venturia nashicola]